MKKVILILFLAVVLIEAYGQTGVKAVLDQNVLARVTSGITDSDAEFDPEELYQKISGQQTLKNWMSQYVAKVTDPLKSAIAANHNQPMIKLSSEMEEKTRHLFLERSFFEQVPEPDISGENTGTNYRDINAAVFFDKKAWEEQVNEVLELAGINAMFPENIIPLEGDGLTQKLFLTKSTTTGKMMTNIEDAKNRLLSGKSGTSIDPGKINRPLRDKAMIAESKCLLSNNLIHSINSIMDDESRRFEELVVAWSPLADYQSTNSDEKEAVNENVARSYRISRAIVLRMFTEKILQCRRQLWKEQLNGLCNLSVETARIFSAANWEGADARRASLSNPILQMAQRSSSIKTKLERLLFEADLIESSAKVSMRNFERMTTESL